MFLQGELCSPRATGSCSDLAWAVLAVSVPSPSERGKNPPAVRELKPKPCVCLRDSELELLLLTAGGLRLDVWAVFSGSLTGRQFSFRSSVPSPVLHEGWAQVHSQLLTISEGL